MIFFRRALIYGCISVSLSLSGMDAHSETPPLPPKKNAPIESLEKLIEEQKAEQKQLEKKANSLEKDMKGLKKDLIYIAGKVQTHESNLFALEQRLSQLKKDKSNITNHLAKEKKSIADLVLALERIRRIPPETLIARPDAPLETAQAATILGSILPELDRRSKKLRLDLDELEVIENELEVKQQKLKETTEKLKTDQANLDQLMGQREKSLHKTKSDVESKTVEITQLSKSAKDLGDLIAKVEQRNRALEKRTGNNSSKKNTDVRISKAEIKSLGSLRLPVSGFIKTKYGELDDIGATSKGMTIEARPGAVVVAPVAGIVRYAGPFKKYGSIILLEHKGKFHSLVAGLGKIDTFVGQSVDAGEPLGRLPDYTGRLYYELRFRGDPVNPSQQFSKLE
ncbi:MAG TPA: peptidoglycan DD-metalloendopeptidase family protein [Alphaproteobacteria bacterium]|jgi:septal ring factor EnvC (AmiA/AmiB activator)|nr:peptidoglycan DD-metalloendopeptidase family protein [Alphaproteobacteria bacterium]HRK97181.1 peptidoglycan DD-metalloendopeptidase family protein [Alphaproteobacteria bacterium]